jgi:cell division protein FtsI/penicillin-binding protein 2
MRNQPGPTWLTRDGASFARRDDRAAPVGRLLALFLAVAVPLVAIAGRLTHVQLARQAAYLEPFAMVRHVERELPARHGRILAADGTVLADDLPTYSLAVHYRWMEDPIDPRWLRRKAWERLTRGERRQTAAVAVAEKAIR